MRLQTDLEFQQNNINKLNMEYDVNMYSTKLRGGKTFAANRKNAAQKQAYTKT